MLRRVLTVFCSVAFVSIAFAQAPPASQKSAVVAAIDARAAELARLSDQVWAFAETALLETKSAEALASYAEAQGFRVRRGVAEMPTAFVAEYGQGAPVIGVLGEYDALPGLSQKAEPAQSPLEAGAPGHGCGHNLLGVGALGAAVAIKEQIAAGKIAGTIRFYGTPAEESVGGKLYMLRAGLFKDVDIVLSWHPGDENNADTRSSQAMVDFIVEFHGKTAHAALDPWNGRSAVDGLEIFTHSVNYLREHVKPTVRMHYSIVDGGQVPNVVPAYAKLWCWVRDSDRDGVEDVMTRIRKIVTGSALAADVEAKLTVQSGSYNMLVNMAGQRLVFDNLKWLGPPAFTPAEQAFAREIQKAAAIEPAGLDATIKPFLDNPGPPEGGSTDVADVSWNVPTLQLTVTTAPKDAPWHAWPVVACGGMSIGHAGMTYAAKALASTMVDLFADPAKRAAIRKEFEAKVAGKPFQSYLPAGPPLVPKR
ncbi:MAG: amidohydrolase [Acidobacteria bacterium]|nr:amidohydrolase [Acidobacteriota bacterium]